MTRIVLFPVNRILRGGGKELQLATVKENHTYGVPSTRSYTCPYVHTGSRNRLDGIILPD
jgi:hypothetical protein